MEALKDLPDHSSYTACFPRTAFQSTVTAPCSSLTTVLHSNCGTLACIHTSRSLCWEINKSNRDRIQAPWSLKMAELRMVRQVPVHSTHACIQQAVQTSNHLDSYSEQCRHLVTQIHTCSTHSLFCSTKEKGNPDFSLT